MVVVDHVEFVVEKMVCVKTVFVLVQETVLENNVALMVAWECVVSVILMRFVTVVDIVLSLVVMESVISQPRIDLTVQLTV